MRALILAAGMGWRLGGGTGQPPKSLLSFGGRTLMERHLEVLFDLGVERVHVGVGYRADMIEAEIVRLGMRGFAQTVYNPQYERGNIVTLWHMRELLLGDDEMLLMDADVLHDYRLLQRLVASPHDNCFLLDRNIEPGEEPVKLCVRGERIVEFGKVVDPAVHYDFHGESVGFFKLAPPVAGALATRSRAYVEDGRFDAFYEDALRDLLLDHDGGAFGYEDITGLPWIEIDFAADVVRAERDILPRLMDRTTSLGTEHARAFD